jgi:hypothetical protein
MRNDEPREPVVLLQGIVTHHRGEAAAHANGDVAFAEEAAIGAAKGG